MIWVWYGMGTSTHSVICPSNVRIRNEFKVGTFLGPFLEFFHPYFGAQNTPFFHGEYWFEWLIFDTSLQLGCALMPAAYKTRCRYYHVDPFFLRILETFSACFHSMFSFWPPQGSSWRWHAPFWRPLLWMTTSKIAFPEERARVFLCVGSHVLLLRRSKCGAPHPQFAWQKM